MKTVITSAAVALIAAAGWAAHSHAQARADWQPTCRSLGCIEPDAGLHAPEGAQLSFERCDAAKGTFSRYRYERQAEGWALVERRESAQLDCEG